VSLDYSYFGARVEIVAGQRPLGELSSVIGVELGDIDVATADLFDAGVNNEDGIADVFAGLIPGVTLPFKTTASATGIDGHRFGGLTTFADYLPPENQVSQTIGNLAVAGLLKFPGSACF